MTICFETELEILTTLSGHTVALECDVEYLPAERRTRDYPGAPESFEVLRVTVQRLNQWDRSEDPWWDDVDAAVLARIQADQGLQDELQALWLDQLDVF